MRSIQDPKKRRLIQKSPVVTSQDPDFPESLLSDPNKPVTYDSKIKLRRDGFTQDNDEHWFKMLPDGTIVRAIYNPPPHGYGNVQKDSDFIKLYESKRDEFEGYDRFLSDLEWLEKNGYFVPEVGYVNTKFAPINLDGEHEAVTRGQSDNLPDWYKKMRDSGGNYIKFVRPEWWETQDDETGYALVLMDKPDLYDEYKKLSQQEVRNRIMSTLDPIGPKAIDTGYSQPEIIETPPTPMLTGRQAVQVGRVAQDRENARYGQVLDKEYYWDDDLKRWQMRPVDEERLGKPFPKDDRKYRLIKASF